MNTAKTEFLGGCPTLVNDGKLSDFAYQTAKALFGEHVEVAEVKTSEVRNRAVCLEDEIAEQRIYEAVKRGIENRDRIPPIRQTLPLEVAVEYNTTALCDEVCQRRTDVERVDGYTVRTVKQQIEVMPTYCCEK